MSVAADECTRQRTLGVCRRLFLVGASGVGKSTLAEAVAPVLDLPYRPISAQSGFQHFGTTPEAAFRDSAIMAKVQGWLGPYTAERLEAYADDPTGYVTDRAFDLSVYGALLGFPHPKATVARVLEAMGRFPSVTPVDVAATVLFIRPHEDVLRIARAKDGGRRSEFLSDEWVYRLDGALCHFLRAQFIPHVELPADCRRLEDRIAFARAAVMTAAPKVRAHWVDPDGGQW